MEKFKTIEARAVKHHGQQALADALKAHKVKSKAQLRKLADDRILSKFSEMIFKSGFSWKVVDQKWPGFEKAFHNFDVHKNAMMSDDAFDLLVKNKDIVRNGGKILSVRDNAVFLKDLAVEHGSAAKFFADWPDSDYVDLLVLMNKRGARLGRATASFALRFLGKPSFILSADVQKALIAAGVVDKEVTGKRALETVQEAFNTWAEESGKDLTAISRTLALSVG